MSLVLGTIDCMTARTTPAETLVAGYARARRSWPPGHVVHVDQRGFCYLTAPGDLPAAEVTVDALPLLLPEAQQILDRLQAEIALEHCLDQVERRQAGLPTSMGRLSDDVCDPV